LFDNNALTCCCWSTIVSSSGDSSSSRGGLNTFILVVFHVEELEFGAEQHVDQNVLLGLRKLIILEIDPELVLLTAQLHAAECGVDDLGNNGTAILALNRDDEIATANFAKHVSV